MGVYVKGVRMPENCSECISSDLRTTIKCTEWKKISAGRRDNERAWSCPLVDLGKHVRLIDADELWNKMSNYTDNEGAKFPFGDDDSIIHRDSACFMIESADTIIEAEDGT